ncbi:MAG TPA: Ldh family oxidoreductase [Solirubrobacteraceae bacterium]|nr:Ldh family oxidoreductase [Solirubrobacteraceae bacterium]
MEGVERRLVGAGELERWTRALLEAAGLEAEPAATVAATLVWTSLRGTDSHGVARVPLYVERLRTGVLNGRPRPSVVHRDGAIAVVDGDHGPGQVAAVLATDLSIALAREHGVGVAVVRRSGHYGAAAFYAVRAAEAGLVGMSLTNAEPGVIPYGGIERALGTNPIALAAPAGAGAIFDLDMATSQVALNRINNARDEGRPIPHGWGVDAHGESTTDPAQVTAGVPLGGYKGYALALMVEVLCGVLAGAGARADDGIRNIGHFHLAIDPERTVGRDAFAGALGGLLDELRAVRPARGFDEVLVAGDPEHRSRARRERDGIPVEPALWAKLTALGRELGVSPPAAS